MRNLLVCFACCAFAVACKKDKKETPAAAPAASTTPAGQTGPAAKPGADRPPALRRQVVPITVEEVQGMIPTLEGGRVIKPVGKAERGERVETTMCFDKAELPALADQIKSKLTAAGWPTVNVRQHPQITDRVGVNANKPPYVFYGSVQRAPYPDCSKDKGQTLVTLSVHKIETVEGVGPVGPRIPGAPGMRPTIPMHPPASPAPAPAQSQ